MVDQNKAVESVRSQFEKRRAIFAGIILIIPCIFFFLMVKGCQSPMVPVYGQGLVEPTRTPMPAGLVTPLLIQRSLPAVEVAAPTTDLGYRMCRAQNDITVGGRRVPAMSLVRVDGYSPSMGGVFLVGGSYQSVLDVRCDDSVPEIAVSIPVSPTPVIRASLGSGGVAATPVRVIQTVVVTATLQPAQVVGNGLAWDGDCVLLNLEGIQKVFVDGRPATGHQKVCGVNNVQIFFR